MFQGAPGTSVRFWDCTMALHNYTYSHQTFFANKDYRHFSTDWHLHWAGGELQGKAVLATAKFAMHKDFHTSAGHTCARKYMFYSVPAATTFLDAGSRYMDIMDFQHCFHILALDSDVSVKTPWKLLPERSSWNFSAFLKQTLDATTACHERIRRGKIAPAAGQLKRRRVGGDGNHGNFSITFRTPWLILWLYGIYGICFSML